MVPPAAEFKNVNIRRPVYPSVAPILLWVDLDAGHGQGKPLNLRVREVADQRAFLMWQLGIK